MGNGLKPPTSIEKGTGFWRWFMVVFVDVGRLKVVQKFWQAAAIVANNISYKKGYLLALGIYLQYSLQVGL